MNLQKLGFSKYKGIRDKPEGRWCDSCAAQVEWTQAIGLRDLSKVSHSELQVLCSEELISNVKFSQCLTPLLSHHMDACFRCWRPKAAAEILSPEQTFKLWQITQYIKLSVTMLGLQQKVFYRHRQKVTKLSILRLFIKLNPNNKI